MFAGAASRNPKLRIKKITLYQQLKSQLGDVIEIDNDYIDTLLSSDPKLSADAHAAAPWLTEAYNKERENSFSMPCNCRKNLF